MARQRRSTAPDLSLRLGAAGALLQSPLSGVQPLFWVRSDTGIGLNAGVTVASWADASGAGHNAVQGTPGNQPVYSSADSTMGNQPSVQLTDATRFLKASGAIATQPNTTFLAGYMPTPSGILLDGATARQRVGANGSHNWLISAGTNVTGSAATSAAHALAAVWNSGSDSLFVDTSGAAVISGAAAGSSGLTDLTIGLSGSSPVGGAVSEVIVFPGALSTGQISLVFQYLAGRYGGAWS